MKILLGTGEQINALYFIFFVLRRYTH